MSAAKGVRRDERKPFAAHLDLIVTGRIGWAHGCDVSLHGACFTCSFRLGRGDALQLDLTAFGAGMRAGIVRHASRQGDEFRVGVEFFEPLSAEEVDVLAHS
jgi:PilZ domain-containing protein